MSEDHKENGKVGEERKPEPPKKPPGYRKFEKLLKEVVKAPPMGKRVISHHADDAKQSPDRRGNQAP